VVFLTALSPKFDLHGEIKSPLDNLVHLAKIQSVKPVLRLQVNFIFNNRAGGNAPLIAQEKKKEDH